MSNPLKAVLMALLILVGIGIDDANAGPGKKTTPPVQTTLQPTPVDGKCGSNASTFNHEVLGFPKGGTFCAAGEPSTLTVPYPKPGDTSDWSCAPKDGGKRDLCRATVRHPPAPPAPPASAPKPVPVVHRTPTPRTPVCRWVKSSDPEVVQSTARFISVPGYAVAACEGTLWVKEVQTFTSASPITGVGGLTYVCD